MKTLLLLTLSGSVLALLLLVLRYAVLRRMPSTVYYYAWILVLLRFALPLPGMIPTPDETRSPEPSVTSATVIQDRRDPRSAPVPTNTVPGNVPAASSEFQRTEQRAELHETQSTALTSGAALSPDWRSPWLWLSVWALGAVISLEWTVLAYLRFTGHLRHELHRPDLFTLELYASVSGRKPALFCSDAIRTPLMFGVLSPKIVLPERDYDEEFLLNIFRHELMHYRRLDTLYKWMAVVILSAHWFNPLSWFIRKELNRACELSCDEMLLRSMTRREKQSYGNTLLTMAATSVLPAGVVATTFATEKENLKERLVQIMNYKKSRVRSLTALLALLLLAGCGMAAGPASEGASGAQTADTQAEGEAIRVTNVDELLAAIAPDTVIELAAGVYDLSTASNYGADTHSSYYSWNGVFGEEGQTHAELVLHNVEGLTLRGAGIEETTIAAVPRYANVVKFVGCRNLTVASLTAGHTTEPGFCSGGVLRLESCTDTSITECGLYGCGTIGVSAADCNNLTVTASRIYECSYNAVSLSQCRNVRVEDCEIDSHGIRPGQGEAMMLFVADYSDGFTVHGCRIHDNAAQYLLCSNYSKNTLFLSNDVHDNRIVSSMFLFEQYAAVVDGCRFETNDFRFWVNDHRLDPINISGEPLESAELNEMTLRDIDPDTAVTPAPVSAASEVPPGSSIRVTTVDEFLAAIGPDRSIILEGESFDLSTASNYGAVGGEYYYWQESHDGPELVIQNVSGLSIGTPNADRSATTVAAVPRYANVLNFRNCDRIQLMDFTAGHTKEPGACSGGVLNFQGCSNFMIYNMGLYGCGILGIQASQCTTMKILNTEIYECSQGAGQFFQTDGIVFTDCDIHDVPSPALRFTECGDKTWNGEPISGLNGMYDVNADGTLTAPMYEDRGSDEEHEYHGAVEDLNNPFANEPSVQYGAGTPQAAFAAMVQQAVIKDEWEALADRIAFPIQFFTIDYSFQIHDREEYLSMVRDGYFTSPFFEETFGFHHHVADADLSVFGSCIFGDTCLDHLIAFSCVGNEVTEDNLMITAISVVTPFWPGRDPYVLVTPQP
ncbi:MAG: right-handed parallel beta-helix repeat-containing protein [Oscillospiraceae bacterium]|nr:right-handed parallel beta-helix repeat-containing protein [Oscillospiraceae bacterium]